MNKKQLFENIKRKKSFLCIGLDTDMEKIPSHLKQEEDPILLLTKLLSMLRPIFAWPISPIWLLRELRNARMGRF